MRWVIIAISVLLAGSIESLNSPGAADEPIHAAQSDLDNYINVGTEMHARWAAIDQQCDPDAIFGLLYLITTAKVGDLVAASHFEDNPFLVDWDMNFAQRYFDAYDAHHDGTGSVPEPWQKAFQHAETGTSTVTEDLLLGMSAHVNYDLAYSAYDMGLPQAGLKDEYDRVNDAFWNVIVPIGDELGARYDPSQARDSDGVGPMDYPVVELLISWRENAWTNAQLLADTDSDPIAFAAAEAKILSEANAVANGLIEGNNGSDTTTDRVAYCHESGHPTLDASLGGPGYGDDWLSQVPDEYLICHRPGQAGEKTMTVNDHARAGHENHGDSQGACEE